MGAVPATCLASAMGENMVTGRISVKEMGTFGTEGTHLGAIPKIGAATFVAYVGGIRVRGHGESPLCEILASRQM